MRRQFENPGFLPKSLFDRYTVRDKTEGSDLQTNIQTLAGAKHAIKKFGRKHPCSALAIVSAKFGEVESYKPANGRELVIDRDNSKDYKKRATEEAKKSVRYELYIGGVLHDTYDTRKEAESFARDRKVTDGKATKIKQVAGNPRGCGNPGYYRGPEVAIVSVGSVSASDGRKLRKALNIKGYPYAVEHDGFTRYEFFTNNIVTKRYIQAVMKDLNIRWTKASDATEQNPRGCGNPHGRANPLTKFRVTYKGKTFEVMAVSRAAAERQVQQVWKGGAVVNPKKLTYGEALNQYSLIEYGKPYDRMDKGTRKSLEDRFGRLVADERSRLRMSGDWRGDLTEDSYRRVLGWLRGNPSRRNPEDLSAAETLYEQFHGVPSTGETVYEEIHEEPDTFTELGDLIEIKVATIHGKDATIAAPDPEGGDLSSIVKLASSADGRQLYFIGGDQELDLEKLGFAESEERHQMLIGTLYELTYRTRKAFHKLKVTDYYHALGEENKNQPSLTYNPFSGHMAVVGGDYHVKDVGIVN